MWEPVAPTSEWPSFTVCDVSIQRQAASAQGFAPLASAANPRLGGHTIARHVGKSEAYLRSRLKNEPSKEFVSSFWSLAEAEWAISSAMQQNATRIVAWAQSTSRAPLVLNENVGRSVGYGLSRDMRSSEI
ncbi:RNase A-like domain-containing protein [Burkholderia anthina]|uniref:RNase A-like domain-containing protein n=1 Tax=Burkholderia anthina TaxID=179879 RepID=UPI00163A7392